MHDRLRRLGALPARDENGPAEDAMAERKPLNKQNLLTLVSLAILVGTEVFGVALAAGWAIAGLFELGATVSYVLMGTFSLAAAWGLFKFMKAAAHYEPVR
jgi:hypothetical protein